MRFRRTWWIVGVLVLAVGSFAVWRYTRPPEDPAARWRTVDVDRGVIQQVVTATGTLNPIGQVNIGTQVSGTIARVDTDFNRKVAAGQVLAVIDDAQFRSALRQAEASLASAQADLALAQLTEQRDRELVARDYIAGSKLDSDVQARKAAQAKVEMALAQLDRARTDLANTVIRAPVAGVVIARKIDVGQTVAASFQTPDLFTIARDLREMEIYANVSEADIGSVRAEQAVQFRVDAYPERRFEGRVREVRLNPKTEQGVVSYNVVIRADNPDGVLLPGMTARVDIVAARRDGVLRVSNSALRYRPVPDAAPPGPGKPAVAAPSNQDRDSERASQTESPRVHVLRAGQPSEVRVKTGISDGRLTEIVEGALQAGDKLIVRDLHAKAPGAVELSF